MAKAEWGIKRICPNCGTRYYDFQKSPPTCPSCATVYDPDALLKSRRTRSAVVDEPKRVAPAAAADDVDDTIEPLDDAADEELEEAGEADVVAEDDEALIEDASELGGDEDIPDVDDELSDDDDR
jgi:uncharacterized protein (TIGR02300 family)